MVNLITAFFICVTLVSPLHAANIKTFGRDSQIEFPHGQHQKSLGGCTDCHGTKTPGPIAQFGEKWAHDTCRACHQESKSGPVECSDCHKNM